MAIYKNKMTVIAIILLNIKLKKDYIILKGAFIRFNLIKIFILIIIHKIYK